MSVLVTDCKKGDVIFFRTPTVPLSVEQTKTGYRIGTIRTVNKQRNTVSVIFNARIDGQITECCWTVPVVNIIGFHVTWNPAMNRSDLSWRTAIKRRALSVPMRYLQTHGLLRGPVLDYGCGRGDDAAALRIDRYDPHFFPYEPKDRYATITCHYVLNVIEDVSARWAVIDRIRALLLPWGTAYVTIRTDAGLNGMTSTGTWQGRIELPFPVLHRTATYCIYIIAP